MLARQQLQSGRGLEVRTTRDLQRIEALEEFGSRHSQCKAAFRPLCRRRPRAMVMFAVRLQSQRRLLLVWQGLRYGDTEGDVLPSPSSVMSSPTLRAIRTVVCAKAPWTLIFLGPAFPATL